MVQGNPNSPLVSPLWDTHNYGGTEMSTTVGFQRQPFAMHIIDTQVSLPLFRRLNGPQLETDYRVMLTWYVEIPTKRSKRFAGRKSNTGPPSELGF